MIPNFNFHRKCDKVQIINVSFVDDLRLFSRGDVMFVQLMIDRFNDFSASIGLYVNPGKCKIYYGGMTHSMGNMLADIIGFSAETLPFRYLGIPLSSKMLTNS